MKIVIYKLNILSVNVATIPKQIQNIFLPPPPRALETIKIRPIYSPCVEDGGVVIAIFVGYGIFLPLDFFNFPVILKILKSKLFS